MSCGDSTPCQREGSIWDIYSRAVPCRVAAQVELLDQMNHRKENNSRSGELHSDMGNASKEQINQTSQIQVGGFCCKHKRLWFSLVTHSKEVNEKKLRCLRHKVKAKGGGLQDQSLPELQS